MAVRFVLLAIALSAVDAHATFGGPLSESASREVAKIGVAPAGQTHASKRMVWTGVAVAGGGVALAGLAVHEANSTYCLGSTVRGCDSNLHGGLLVTGAVAISAGAIVAVVGALPIRRPDRGTGCGHDDPSRDVLSRRPDILRHETKDVIAFFLPSRILERYTPALASPLE